MLNGTHNVDSTLKIRRILHDGSLREQDALCDGLRSLIRSLERSVGEVREIVGLKLSTVRLPFPESVILHNADHVQLTYRLIHQVRVADIFVGKTFRCDRDSGLEIAASQEGHLTGPRIASIK